MACGDGGEQGTALPVDAALGDASDTAVGGNGGASNDDTPPLVPTIDSLAAYLAENGAVGVTFEGRPGPIPIRFLYMEWLDEAGESLGANQVVLPSYSAFGSRRVGFIEESSTAFSGSATFIDALLEAPAFVRVRIADQQEEEGPAVQSEVVPATPQLVDLGQSCDPFGALTACPNSSACDKKDPGHGELPTCQVLPTTCPLDLPVLVDVYEGTNGVSDSTRASCTSSRGDIGTEQGHVFTAPQSGSYRFSAESITANAALTLFVRRYCEFQLLGGSELACNHVNDDAVAGPTLELDLASGDTVYVFVEAWWVNGGLYRLTVEGL